VTPRPTTRRAVLLAAAGIVIPAARTAKAAGLVQADADGAATRALGALEARAGGRLGVCLLEAGRRRVVGNRLDERFAMCSTFKLALAAMVLREADAGRLRLDETLPVAAADLVPFAPLIERHIGERLSLMAIAEAAQVESDNAAANLLLKRVGGPAAFTAFVRAVGDVQTRLDRLEPELNLVRAGDVRDTTTPRAMAQTVARLLTGDVLAPASRDRLAGWMRLTKRGTRRLRAGLPADWRAGDKPGTAQARGMTDKVNDIAVAWPPSQAPLVVTAYYDSARATGDTQAADEALLADVGRIAAAWVM
jgi:beta-lactamase class A